MLISIVVIAVMDVMVMLIVIGTLSRSDNIRFSLLLLTFSTPSISIFLTVLAVVVTKWKTKSY